MWNKHSGQQEWESCVGAIECSMKHNQLNQGCGHWGVFPLAPLSVLGGDSCWFFSSNRSGLSAW